MEQSYLLFVLQSIGTKYLILLPLSVGLATWIVWQLSRPRAQARTSSLLGVTVLLPFGVGLMAMLDGLTMTWMKIYRVEDALSTLRIADVAPGFVQSSIAGSVGLMLSAIPYCVAVYCACHYRKAELSNAADSR